MKDEKNNFSNIERKLQRFFQKQAESLKASKDLWPKLESRLDEKLKDVGPNKYEEGIGTVACRTSTGCSLGLRIGRPDTDSCRLVVVNNKSFSQYRNFTFWQDNDYAWTGWQCP